MRTNNKQREALKEIRKAMMLDSGCGPTTELHAVVDSITQTALAEPVLNCEVGTTEEQAERMRIFCEEHGEPINGGYRCDRCPLCSVDRCELAWAQMPYEEGGRDEDK